MLRKATKVWQYQLRREFLFSERTISILSIIGIYVFAVITSAADCGTDLDIGASPAGFVFLFNDYICQIIITLGFVFIMSSAPFIGDNYHYIVGRSGRTAWEMGNILYILTASFLYIILIVLASWIGLARCIQFTDGWGRLWNTLARTTAGSSYELQFSVNAFLIGKYDVVYASFGTITLEWLCYSWLGLCIYLLNRYVNRSMGLCVAGIAVFLDTMIYNAGLIWLYRFSPVTLSQLSRFTKGAQTYGVSEQWAWSFFSIGILIMIMVGLICSHKEGSIDG